MPKAPTATDAGPLNVAPEPAPSAEPPGNHALPAIVVTAPGVHGADGDGRRGEALTVAVALGDGKTEALTDADKLVDTVRVVAALTDADTLGDGLAEALTEADTLGDGGSEALNDTDALRDGATEALGVCDSGSGSPTRMRLLASSAT